jgi:hypothetical protein
MRGANFPISCVGNAHKTPLLNDHPLSQHHNLGWLPPLRSLTAHWWPLILIIVGILLLARRSSGGKQ